MSSLKLKVLAAAAALLATPSALADPISITWTLITVTGATTLTGAIAIVAQTAVAIGTLASTIYGSVAARRKAKNLAADARARFNAELEDRNTTVLSTVPPWQIIYGRATVAGSIHAMFTSNKTAIRTDGTQYTKADALRHLVYVFAAHECATVHDVKINGESCGPFDVNGVSLHSDYVLPSSAKEVMNVRIDPAASVTLSDPIVIVSTATSENIGSVMNDYEAVWTSGSYTLSNGDKTITNNGSAVLHVSFTMSSPQSTLRVRIHMGSPDQTVDTYLNGLFPEQWTVNHRIRGRLYAVVTLDLEDTKFQAGPPQLTVDVTGKLVYDPRNASTTGSSNPALCINDFLKSRWGAEALDAEINSTLLTAAANACDATINTKVPGYANDLVYNFNGTTDSFTATGASLSSVSNALRVTPSSDTYRVARTLSVSGATARYVRISIKRVSGKTWNGCVRYSTAGHGYSNSYRKNLAGGFDTGGGYQTLVFDMHTLTAGAGDWKNSTITGIQLQLGTTKNDVFDLDWVALSHFAETTITGPKYTVNGAFRTDSSREGILDALSLAMCGFTSQSGQWLINAGAWTSPIKDFGDADLDGQIEIVQTDTSMEELANCARGTYFDEGESTPIDFEPYKNATLIAADGNEELWEDIALPFTNTEARARSIARITVERLRSGQVLRAPFQLQAWPIQVGDRIRLTSGEYALNLKTYRVTDWNFDLHSPVVLTLQEDTAATYDEYDTTLSDPTPNSDMPNPNNVPVVEGLTVESGTEHLIRMTDGTVAVRAYVYWTLSEDRYVSTGTAFVQLMWQRLGKEDPNTWHEVMVPATSTGTYVDGLRTGEAIVFAARYINSAGIPGLWSAASQVITGKSAAPTNVTGLTATKVTNGVRIDWATCPDLDYDETELRKDGTGWSDATPLVGSVFMGISGNSYLWVPAAGTYTIRAKHRDTSGNESATAASVAVTVSAADLIEWGDVSGRPKMFRAMSRGNSDTGAPFAALDYRGGLADGETGAMLQSNSNMYTVVKIARSTGAWTFVGYYNPLSGALGGLGEANAMAAALNAIGPDYVVVVTTFDEPQGNRMLGNLPAAMYRCGASRAVFGAPGTYENEPGSRFKYRAAYILIGIAGCGEGNGYEAYQGSVDLDTNAWCDTSFYLQNGNLVISGAAATPRSLQDYAYTGAMNATYGATWSSNITNQPGDSALLNSYNPIGVNLIPNSAFESGLAGWSYSYHGVGADLIVNYSDTWRLAPSAAPWTSVFCFQQANATYDPNYYHEIVSHSIPVKPSTRYVLSGYLNMHRAYGAIFLRTYTSAGANITDGSAWAYVSDNNVWSDAKSLDHYARVNSDYTTPSNCAFVTVVIRKYATLSGTSSYLFGTRFMLEEAGANSGMSQWTENPGVPLDMVTTSQLRSQAATELLDQTSAGPLTDGNGVGVTVTLSETTKVVVRFSGMMRCTNSTGSQKIIDCTARIRYDTTENAAIVRLTKYIPNGESWSTAFLCEATLTLAAGSHTIYGRQDNGFLHTIDASAEDMTNHVELIKR